MPTQAWKSSTLKGLTLKIGSGATPTGGKGAYKEVGVFLIRSMNVHDYSFKWNDLACIDEKQSKKLDNVNVLKNDVLLNITGASVARCCIVPEEALPARVNQHVAIIRLNQDKILSKFAYYSLVSSKNKQRLLSIAQGGATREALTKESLEGFEISYPKDIKIQNKIAGVLSAYDDLIENNNKRIQILEEVAQKLYKHWFVDFKFPGHERAKFVGSELGLIPEGWSCESVGGILKRKPAGLKYTQKNVGSSGSTPVIDQSTNDVLGYHNNKADQAASTDNPIIIFGDHTCKMQILIKPFSVGANVIPFVPLKSSMPTSFLYYLISSLVSTKEYKRHWSELVSKEIILPSENLQQEYNLKIIDLLSQMDKLKECNFNLERTRDMLLPKLISGELDVSNLEIKM